MRNQFLDGLGEGGKLSNVDGQTDEYIDLLAALIKNIE